MSRRGAGEPAPLPPGVPRPVGALAQRLSALPGIGEKSAMRLAVALVTDQEMARGLGEALVTLHEQVLICSMCCGLAERDGATNTCAICRDPRRDQELLCVVAKHQDMLAIERSGAMRGRYFVLGKMIDPLGGIGPEELPLKRLVARAAGMREVMLALPASTEGNATMLTIGREMRGTETRVTRIAHGVQHGADLEFADALTLTAALQGRGELT